MIDHLFADCERIAKQYDREISDVVIDFTLIEMQIKGQHAQKDVYRAVIKQLRFDYQQLYGTKHEYQHS